MYDVIIVGGGVTGLMAGKLLSAEGKKVLLLEARENLGGRIQRLEEFSINAEGGAEFIHGNLKTTFSLLKQANLKKQEVSGHFCRVEKGKWNADKDFIPHWDLLLEKMKDCKEDISIEGFLAQFFQAKKYDALKKRFKKYIEGYDAADIKDTSVFAIRREMEKEDETHYRPLPDYTALVNFLKEACVKCNTKIKTSEPVLQITTEKNIGVITSLAAYTCRKIIIAVPLGVLQCSPTAKEFINFPLCVKEHITAAKKIGNGGVIKFLLEFDEAFWLDKKFLKEKSIPAPSYIFTDTIIPTLWTQHPSSNPLLTAWLGGPKSYKMKNYSEKKLKKIAMESLSSVFSMPVNLLENKLKVFKIINWVKEPYILGAYSYPTLQTAKARLLLRQPVENAFYFSGEYVFKNSSSTVDDALQSGKEVAGRVLKELGGNKQKRNR